MMSWMVKMNQSSSSAFIHFISQYQASGGVTVTPLYKSSINLQHRKRWFTFDLCLILLIKTVCAFSFCNIVRIICTHSDSYDERSSEV